MLAVSPEFLTAIRGPHQLAIEVTATSADGTQTIELPVMDGTITIDRTADHRRRLDLTIADPTLYPSSTSGIINVYGTTITVKRGITYGDGQTELIQEGVFRVEDASRDLPAGALQITGWDASRQLLDARFFAPRKFTAQLATDLIQLLISEVYDGTVFPAAVFNITTADATTIPKHVVDRDRWPEIQRVAAVIGCEVFADADGTWVIQDTPDLSTAASVWDIDAGTNGVLVGATDSVTREGVPNAVIALGESVNGGTVSGEKAPIHSTSPHGRDLDPNSPTYLLGPYGGVARFYSSPHIKTAAQANKVADAQLADHLGATRVISFNAVPNPALDAGDCITVVRPDGTTEKHIIDVLTIPLSPGGVMTGETRAQDWTAA